MALKVLLVVANRGYRSSMRLSGAITVLMIGAAGCREATSPSGPGTLFAAMQPPLHGNSMSKCLKLPLSLEVKDDAGSVVTPDSTRWVSSDITVATVTSTGSATGVVHALRPTVGVTVEALLYKLPRRGSVYATFSILENSPGLCAP